MKLYNWNMSRFWRHLKPRRKYKDKLFQRVFSDKKDLLDLYNAVNQTSSTPVLECQTRMVNINYGHNQKLLDCCKRLHDYSYFVAEVNKNLDLGYHLKDAIFSAINTCINNDVLSDILVKSQSEVFNMLLTEYDEKRHFKMLYKEGHEDGTNEAIRKTITMLRKLNTPEETIFQLISEEYNMSVEEIKNISNQS